MSDHDASGTVGPRLHPFDVEVQTALAEYNLLKTEIGSRSTHQHQLIQLHVATMTVLLGAAFTTDNGAWAAVAVAIESSIFGLWYFDHALSIAELSGYIRNWTHRRLTRAAANRLALKWESAFGRGVTVPATIRVRLFRWVVFGTFFLPGLFGLALGGWLTYDQYDDHVSDAHLNALAALGGIGALMLYVLGRTYGYFGLVLDHQGRRRKRRERREAAKLARVQVK